MRISNTGFVLTTPPGGPASTAAARGPRSAISAAQGPSRRQSLAYYRRSTRAHPRARFFEIATLATAAVCGFALLAGTLMNRAYDGRALPGVSFGTLPLSGLGRTEVRGLLDAHASAFLANPVTFTFGDREWRPPAAEIGLSLDTEAMAGDALLAGRNGPAIVGLAQPALSTFLKSQVILRAALDHSQLAAFFAAVALEVDRGPVDADLAVKNGEVAVGRAAQGREVDVAASVERVQVPRSLESQRVEIVVKTTQPTVDDAALSEAQDFAARVVSGPLTLRAGSRTWTLTPTALGAMLDVRRVGGATGGATSGGEKLAASLNEPKVAAYVRTLAAQIDRQPTDAQLRWTGVGLTVIRESADGARLDQPAAVKSILEQAASENREVVLNVAVAKPAVASDNLAQLGVSGLVATGTSRYAGSSPERANNIMVATSRLNGTVIPAGATFSFLNALGPITKENGYREGLTIQGDATVPGIGGGVCQVSTTAFRAAFYAGLPIVERHQHTYRVSYYEQDGSPVGFDAAVYSPGVDLKFRNDTGSAILIQSGVDPATSTVVFRFYGTPTGREVKLAASKANEIKAGPRLPDGTDPSLPPGTRKQVEWSADGADATIRRSITVGGQAHASDSFFSRYVPWREKWVVGPVPAAQPTRAAQPTARATL